MKDICRDLKDEYDALDAIVANLDEQTMNTVTPFFGWTIRNEIVHIAYFDEAGKLAATDPKAFAEHTANLMQGIKNDKDLHKKAHDAGQAMSVPETMAWWRENRTALVNALLKCDPKDRLPWYGPDMGARSFATARLMETWAHGQDVVDTLKIVRPGTDRLSHVAHIGFITFGWTFVNRSLDIPKDPVRVEITSPSGQVWTYGPQQAKNLVKGSALDFCLVVTQRRNVADTSLKVTGKVAKQWMSIAQAFAGPPENPPAPGAR